VSGELLLGPLREVRRATVLWAVSLSLLVGVNTLFWPTVRDSPELGSLTDQFPAGLAEAFGISDLTSPEGYLESQQYAVLLPMLISVAGVVIASGLTARREDAGHLELVLAQPVSRAVVLAGRAAVAAAALAAAGIAVLVTQLVTDALVDLVLPWSRLTATMVLTVLLAWVYAGVGLAVAGLTGRPGVALALGVGLVIAGYVVSVLFPLSDPLEPWRHASPWDWALGGEPLRGSTSPWRYAALLAAAGALTGVGLLGFGRRDLRAA
jgi:ABC-2 type transport system permease protein